MDGGIQCAGLLANCLIFCTCVVCICLYGRYDYVCEGIPELILKHACAIAICAKPIYICHLHRCIGMVDWHFVHVSVRVFIALRGFAAAATLLDEVTHKYAVCVWP